MQSKFDLLSEAYASMSLTLSQLIAHLKESGTLNVDSEFIQRWEDSSELLARQGLKCTTQKPSDSSTKTICPGCNSVLRDIKSGSRCDWCGHVFPLSCPSCRKELEKIKGEPGDLCLWCHYRF